MSPSAAIRKRTGRRFGKLPRDPKQQFFAEKPLYKKLFSALPQYRREFKNGPEQLSIHDLAADMKVSRTVIYRWCNEETKMRRANAEKIIGLAGGKLELKDFIEYLA